MRIFQCFSCYNARESTVWPQSSSARIVVVKIMGPSVMCRSDEVGEICVQSASTGSGFWGLPGKTANVFQVRGLQGRACVQCSSDVCCHTHHVHLCNTILTPTRSSLLMRPSPRLSREASFVLVYWGSLGKGDWCSSVAPLMDSSRLLAGDTTLRT